MHSCLSATSFTNSSALWSSHILSKTENVQKLPCSNSPVRTCTCTPRNLLQPARSCDSTKELRSEWVYTLQLHKSCSTGSKQSQNCEEKESRWKANQWKLKCFVLRSQEAEGALRLHVCEQQFGLTLLISGPCPSLDLQLLIKQTMQNVIRKKYDCQMLNEVYFMLYMYFKFWYFFVSC